MDAPVVTIETSVGTFAVECVRTRLLVSYSQVVQCADARRAATRLYVKHAPKTCQNFLDVRREMRERRKRSLRALRGLTLAHFAALQTRIL